MKLKIESKSIWYQKCCGFIENKPESSYVICADSLSYILRFLYLGVCIKNVVTESRGRYHKLAYYCQAHTGVGIEAKTKKKKKNKKQLIKTVNGRGTYLFVVVVVYYLHVSLNNLKRIV